MEDHRIVLRAPHRQTDTPQHHQIELDVLADLGDPLVLEQRPHDLRIFRRILLLEGNVPRFERLYGQRHADDAVVEDIEPRGLGVETEFAVFPDLGNHFAQLGGILHKAVIVGRGLRRLELHGIGFGLKLGNGNLGGGQLDHRVAEEIALSDQRRAFGGGGLGPCHLRKLGLRLLAGAFGLLLGGRKVRKVVHKGLEIQFGKEGLEFVDMGFADREVFFAERDGHVEADGGQGLGKAQLVAPFGDLLALLALDLRDVVEDILHRPPLLHEFAGALLADPRHARDIVRSIAPQCEDVAHEAGGVDAVFPADRLPVDDLDAALGALLLVNLAIVTYQLAVVLVGRDHEDLVTRLDAFLRQRADHVVCLVTLDFEDRDAHGFQHPFDIGDGEEDVLGRLGAVGLVLGKYLPAEAASLGVERHAQQVGPLTLLDVAQELYEAEYHGGIHTGPVAHGTTQKGIVILEYQRIGVDEKQFFHIFNVASIIVPFRYLPCAYPLRTGCCPVKMAGYVVPAGPPGGNQRLSSANHSANEVAVSCRRSECSSTPRGRRRAIRAAKSPSMSPGNPP